MSDEWWRRRKKRRRPFFDVFKNFESIEKMMNEMMRQAFSRSFRTPSKTLEKRRVFGPHFYGFSFSLGPNGKPRIREFGNVQKSPFGARFGEKREPLVDVLEADGEVVVVAELPGVEKGDINLHTSEGQLNISVNTPNRKYHKKLSLPEGVDPKSVKTSYNNGVLEVRLTKAEEKKFKGERIRIE